MQDDGDNHIDEDNSAEARTRQSLVSADRALYSAGAPAAAATAAQALAAVNQALNMSNRASFGQGSFSASSCADAEGDAFTSGPTVTQSVFSSPFSAVPAATRGRLQTYTQGIIPAAYARQSSQNYCCLEGGQIGNSALELQRSR